ncbi:MAG: hypothetical protein WA294_17265, partial [Acidobacteriaceae bacterium]
DNYGHDTQGYCVAVFGAGFVTHQSLVRGNLCINNGRSPRMAKNEGAIYIYTWNGGSIDGLTVVHNTVEWSPFNNAPPILNKADLTGSAVLRNNSIFSTAPSMVDTNTSLSFAQNQYRYYGLGNPVWRYGSQTYPSLRALEDATHQESGSTEMPLALRLWPGLQSPASGIWRLDCTLPVSLNTQGLLNDAALRQIIVIESQAQQYFSRRLEVTLHLTSPDPSLFTTAAFRDALLDLDLGAITVTHSLATGPGQMTLSAPDGKSVAHWDGFAGPVALGAVLRRSLGEPVFAQMDIHADDK